MKEKQNLEIRFTNEKETFNATSELKIKIEELKIEQILLKGRSNFEKAAQIEYGEIQHLKLK